MVEHAVPEVEVADGFTVDDPAPVPRHQRVVNRLLASLAVPLEEAGLTAEISGGGVVLPGADPAHGLIPDVMAVRSDVDIDELSVLDAGEVVLAVEVLSRSSRRRDLADKLRIYAEMGIPHYWIVDPKAPVTIATHILEDGVYRQSRTASGDEQLTVTEPFQVILTPSALARKREA